MGKIKYKVLEQVNYISYRYGKTISLKIGFESDGATGAYDLFGDVEVEIIETSENRLVSKSFLVHDMLCKRGSFDNGDRCTNWQASQVLKDILLEEGHKYIAKYWFWATFLFGGDQARRNGMISLKK